MKIKMRKQTRYGERVYRAGTVHDIDSATAQRWIRNRLATRHSEIPEASAGNMVKFPPSGGTPYRHMKFNELRKLAKEREINSFKKTQNELIELLERSDRVIAGPPEAAESDRTGNAEGAEETQNQPDSGESGSEAAGDTADTADGEKTGQKKTSESAKAGGNDAGGQ